MSKEAYDFAEQYKEFYEKWEKSMTEAMKVWASSPIMSRETEGRDENFDPVSHYKKFYETWEKTSSDMMEEWVNSPLFAASMGKAVEKSSDLKKHFDEVVEKTLKNMRFPSKKDIDRLLVSINKLEAKINDLTDKVDDLSVTKKTGKK